MHHFVFSDDYNFALSMFEDGFPPIQFYLSGGLFHIGAVVLLALMAASPMELRSLLKKIIVGFSVLVVYHVSILFVEALCPFSVLGRPFSPLDQHYLERMPQVTQQVLAGLDVFNITIGWQLAPLVIWAVIAARARVTPPADKPEAP